MMPYVMEDMVKKLDKIVYDTNNVIDYDKFDDDYILPKLVLQALLKEEQFQFKLLDKTDYKYNKKLIEQLYAIL